MDTAATTAGVDPRDRDIERWALLGGVVFPILYVIGTILLLGGSPDSGSLKFATYFADAGHRDRVHFGWIISGLSLFALIFFVAALRDLIRRADGDGFLAGLASLGGGIYIAVSLASVGLVHGIRTMSDDTYRHQVFYGVLHAGDDASYVMHATGTAGMAAMILAISLFALRTGVLPRWLAWVGFFAAICALASIIFFTTLFWLLWLLVVAVLLFVRATRTTGRRAAST
jgi:hypothetical protein